MGGQTVCETLHIRLCIIFAMMPYLFALATQIRVETFQQLNGSSHVKSAEEHFEEAFEEQGYYLQQLFLQYGNNGTLSYEGLQKLLGSLGLGEVSILEIRHGGTKASSQSSSHSHSDEELPPKTTVGTPITDFESVLSGSPEESVHPEYFPLPGLRTKLEESVSLLSDHHTEKHLHGNCLNVTQLLWNFGLGQASHITPAHFTFLCPALLYQIDSGVCLRHTEDLSQTDSVHWGFLRGWASLALLVISLPSLLALGLAPLLRPPVVQIILCPMSGLAASVNHHNEHKDAVLKGLSVLGGLYLLFIFESLLGLKQHFKSLKKRTSDEESARELDALQGTPSDHGHSHGPGQMSSLTGGLSTSIAVFCHELPHELGDLTVLLAAGWPLRRLALFSGLSALLGFVGMFSGTALGSRWVSVSPWILSLTAGMPAMLHRATGGSQPFKYFFLQALGLLMGAALMVCIALFEERITDSLGEA
ncbi:hypothetical protein DNTS_009116 [Danionella cerebrum]|uniref:Zinc transporter ZIP4 N-terminal domain-containing protein n=1 Tax=Danionella cerebrum TaxID=2873325 RepID=A0A553QAR4_9TELE|nr:hypothetical protein DNTS_009116 [Danionella translucida]